MENENLALWSQHEDINPLYTKPITGKDYKGTSPHAQGCEPLSRLSRRRPARLQTHKKEFE